MVYEDLRRDLQHCRKLRKHPMPCKEDYEPDYNGYGHITRQYQGIQQPRTRTKLSNGQDNDQNWEPPVLLLANQPYTPSVERLYDKSYDSTRV